VLARCKTYCPAVGSAKEAASEIAGYDRDVAARVLAWIVSDLGGPADPAQALPFLTTPESRAAGGAQSTREWKADFALRERARALGIELAKLLG
jgi:hypothetical protein